MKNQGQNNPSHGTNNSPFSPVSAVTDSYSQMSVSDIGYDSVSRMQELLDESLGIENRNEPQIEITNQPLPNDFKFR